jgi:hypothetical protein
MFFSNMTTEDEREHGLVTCRPSSCITEEYLIDDINTKLNDVLRDPSGDSLLNHCSHRQYMSVCYVSQCNTRIIYFCDFGH